MHHVILALSLLAAALPSIVHADSGCDSKRLYLEGRKGHDFPVTCQKAGKDGRSAYLKGLQNRQKHFIGLSSVTVSSLAISLNSHFRAKDNDRIPAFVRSTQRDVKGGEYQRLEQLKASAK